MAGQDWSIKIVPYEGSAGFEPDVPDGQVGQPLQAQNGDLISWNNRTGDAHWPWAIDPDTGQPYPSVEAAQAASMYLSDEIPAWQSSSPAFLTVAPASGCTNLDYICHLHPTEKGQIQIWATV